MKKLIFKAPVTTASGYGVHSRQILKAILQTNKFDVSIKCLNWGNTSFLHEDNELMGKIKELAGKFALEQQQNVQYDVSVQVTIPNEFEKMAHYNIGITAGIEVDLVSVEWLQKTNQNIDLLIVPSKHSFDVFRNTKYQGSDGSILELNKNMIVVPEGFDSEIFNPQSVQYDDLDLDFSTNFNFLFVGLGVSEKIGEERKNVSNLIKWFCETFKDNEDVGLVLKTGIVNNCLMDFEKTRAIISQIKKSTGCQKFPKIHLVHGRLSDEELAKLYKNPKIKAFISLTHGEGYGLPLLEAAACGLPVMATNWSGHLDFLQVEGKKTFVEIDYEMGKVPASAVWPGVIENDTSWANPKEQDVKLKLKKIYASYEKPKQWAETLSQHVLENFSEKKVLKDLGDEIVRYTEQHLKYNPKTVNGVVDSINSQFQPEDEGKKLLYTMPMSAGDVYISTAVIDSLKKKFPDHKIFFATKQEYSSIVKNNPNIHKVIAWNDWMMNVPICEKIFDEVYTPNLAVQMTFSNWVHKGKGRLLANEVANNCHVELGEYYIELHEVSGLPEKYIVLHPGSGKGQHEARNYLHWQEVVNNIKNNLNQYAIVQVGLEEDLLYDGCLDFRGKTNYNQLATVIKNAELVLGIDSVSMHMAAGLGTKHIALFGSSYATSTGPAKSKSLSVLMETPTRYSCEKACYNYTCTVDKEHPCINEISGRNVYENVLKALGETENIQNYQEYNPKISGYTHVFNAETGGYPYIASISSMLGFCDEVIVVDGGSTDGTVEKIRAIGDDRIQIIEKKWDWDEPRIDGMQKAFGRAMCSGEFLWQQDSDEVIMPRDYEKVKKLAKKFPKSTDLLHLPVIELWGDEKTVRTDRHSWKWRMSRNNFRITHDVVKHARMINEENGKIYSKKGASDGCEYVDIMTHEYIPHYGFYNQELENLRINNPQEYGRKMNEIFNELPSVVHYSWANIPRKIKNFKQTWNKLWSNLYQEDNPTDRFPDVDGDDEKSILVKAKELQDRGGEHGQAQTFQLNSELIIPKLV